MTTLRCKLFGHKYTTSQGGFGRLGGVVIGHNKCTRCGHPQPPDWKPW